MNPDVIVVGAGPAGTSAAIRLARSGRSVRLYEKAYFPRKKLCGGFLSPEALTDLEDLSVLDSLKKIGAWPIHRMVIASRQSTTVESTLSTPALSITRDVLDELLLQQAIQAGVDVHMGTDGFQQKDISDYRVIAAGRQSYRREHEKIKQLTPWYARSSDEYFGMQAFFEDVPTVTDQVELDLITSGYVGLSRVTPSRVNVCTLTTRKTINQWGPSLDCVLYHFMNENPVLRNHLQGSKRVGEWISVGPVELGIRRLTQDRTFYVGDAACVVDPFAGEGMSIGLYTSQLLIGALNQKKYPPQKAYEQSWRQAFLPALCWNGVMRGFYSCGIFREPILRSLRYFPQGLQWLSDLTRYRTIESVAL